MERAILDALCKEFHLVADDIGVSANLFDLGVSSIELLRFKTNLQRCLSLPDEIPLITILANPDIFSLAKAVEELSQSKLHEYNPVVTLQSKGNKTPLWLIHPGVGEVLVFLNLGKYIMDRPVYAIRARGFNPGEDYFQSISEAVETYHAHIKRITPRGPYAIAGYSFGAMLAFEISKVLEQEGETVAFLAALNLPPHIKMRMQQLDWIEVLLNLAYFLGFLSESEAHKLSPMMHTKTSKAALDYIMEIAPYSRLEELDMSREKLFRWASLAHAMQNAARDYEPSGSVASIDVFYAIPLTAVAESKEQWLTQYLAKWQDFSRSPPRFHEVNGAHYTMLNPENIISFHKILQNALIKRNI